MQFIIINQHLSNPSSAAYQRLKAFVLEATKNNHKIVIITTIGETELWKNLGCKVISIKTKATNKSKLLLRVLSEFYFLFFSYIYTISHRKSIFYISSPPFTLYLLPLFRKKIKYILDVRDIYPDILFQQDVISYKSILGKLLKRIEHKIYNKALLIFTATETLKDIISNRTDNKVLCSRNGVYRSDYNKINYVEPHKRKNLVFHGILGRYQDISYLIRLSKFLKDTDAIIDVYGYGKKANIIIESIKKGNKNIIFHGQTERDEIIKKLPNYLFGISPRTDDTISNGSFPVKIYEYLMAGVPVLSVPHTEAGKILEENEAGFQFHTAELNKVMEMIDRCSQDSQYYEALCNNAKKLSHQFIREKIAHDQLLIIEPLSKV